MKPKILLCLALVLSGALFGCSTMPRVVPSKSSEGELFSNQEVVCLKSDDSARPWQLKYALTERTWNEGELFLTVHERISSPTHPQYDPESTAAIYVKIGNKLILLKRLKTGDLSCYLKPNVIWFAPSGGDKGQLIQISPENPVAGAQGLATNDAQVINAALKTILEKYAWNTWWTNGDFIVLYPRTTNEGLLPRSSLSRSLDEFMHNPLDEIHGREWMKGSNDLQVLQEIRKSAGPDSDLEPPTMAELKDMDLDPRIVVSRIKFGEPFELGGASITNRMGKKGRVISIVQINPPGYSRNGRYAVLETGWSCRPGGGVFFLESIDGHWRVVQVIMFPPI